MDKITRLQTSPIRGLAVDIDETLSWTIGYWVEQMQIHFGNPEQLSITEMITKYQYTQHVPYWQTDEALEWMEAQRHSNELQKNLPLIDGSNTVLQQIHKIIPVIAYLTIRPESVLDGTREWLKTHHFPEAEIIARPATVATAEGNQWKADMLSKLYPTIIGIIDDNPAVAIALPKDYRGTIYLYNSVQPTRSDIHIVSCPTWKNILQEIVATYSNADDREGVEENKSL